MTHVLDQLFKTIEKRRRTGDPDVSYVADLCARGLPVIARKTGEEAIETITAALSPGAPAKRRKMVAEESADLLFHLLVLWAESGVAPKDVWAVLQQREGISGIAEKKSRPAKKPTTRKKATGR